MDYNVVTNEQRPEQGKAEWRTASAALLAVFPCSGGGRLPHAGTPRGFRAQAAAPRCQAVPLPLSPYPKLRYPSVPFVLRTTTPIHPQGVDTPPMCQIQYDITYEDLNPTFLFTCQISRKEPERLHSHDFIEIALILSGEGHFVLGGKWYPVKKGDVLLINPGIQHQCTYSSAEAPLEEFYVAFTDIHIRDMERNQILFPGHECLIRPGEKTFVTLSRLCSLIKTESTSCQPGRYFMLKAYVTQMILLLYREQVVAPVTIEEGYEFESTNKKYVVEQIIDYLDCHYNEKISLDQIARNMYLSPFYISKIFKSETGDTPINHLIKIRMEKARLLLDKQKDASIQDIALCVGYDDAYHFSKLFKKHFGESPSKYRKKQE